MKVLSSLLFLSLLAFIASSWSNIPENGKYLIKSNSDKLIHRISFGDTISYSRCQEKEKVRLITESKFFEVVKANDCSFELKPTEYEASILEIQLNDNKEKTVKLTVEVVERERLRGALFSSNESTQRRFVLEDDLRDDSVVYLKKDKEVLALLGSYYDGIPGEMILDNDDEIEGLELVAEFILPVDSWYSMTWTYYVSHKYGKIELSINEGHQKLLVKVY